MKNENKPVNAIFNSDGICGGMGLVTSEGLSHGLTKREHFASIAPYNEIDAAIGDTAESAAQFLDIAVEEYLKDGATNYLKCCMLARRMWADALLKELDK